MEGPSTPSRACACAADKPWEPKVLKSLKRAKGECVRMRAQHRSAWTTIGRSTRSAWPSRCRGESQHDAARFRATRPWRAVKAVAKRSTDCKDAQEHRGAAAGTLRLNRSEGILSKDKTPADIEALVNAFEPHRLAEAGEHNVAATDALPA